jgi:hypothetical protein
VIVFIPICFENKSISELVAFMLIILLLFRFTIESILFYIMKRGDWLTLGIGETDRKRGLSGGRTIASDVQ